MKIKVTLCALLVAAAILPPFGNSQEAKIMILEKDDSSQLAAAYKDYKSALKRWETAKTEIAKKYTMEGDKALVGWEKVQFSVDFRAIVPETSSYANAYICGPHYSWVPATSTSTTSGITSGSGITTTANNAINLSSGPTSDEVRIQLDGVRKDVTTKERRVR